MSNKKTVNKDNEDSRRRRTGGRSARVRAQVLEAVLVELGEVGYSGFNMARIAARASKVRSKGKVRKARPYIRVMEQNLQSWGQPREVSATSMERSKKKKLSARIVAPGLLLAVAQTLDGGKIRVGFFEFIRQFLKGHLPFPPDEKI